MSKYSFRIETEDFAKFRAEMQGLAGSSKEAQAALDRLTASSPQLATAFQRADEAAKKVVESNRAIVPATTEVAEAAGKGSSAVELFAKSASGLGQVVGKLGLEPVAGALDTVGGAAKGLAGVLSGTVLGGIGAVVTAGAALYGVVQNWDTIVKSVTETWQRLNGTTVLVAGNLTTLDAAVTELASAYESADERARRLLATQDALARQKVQESLVPVRAEITALEAERARLANASDLRTTFRLRGAGFDTDTDQQLLDFQAQRRAQRNGARIAEIDRELAARRQNVAQAEDFLTLPPPTVQPTAAGGGGGAAAEADTLTAALQRTLGELEQINPATQKYGEQLAVLMRAQRENRLTQEQYTEAVAKAGQIMETALNAPLRALQSALDPAAAAQARVTEQTRTLSEAFERGAVPLAEYTRLADRAKSTYLDTVDKIGTSTSNAGSNFNQFFGNLSSRFEDAIINGKKFGDVMKSLEQDIARFLLRSMITNPLAQSATDAMKGSGGSGLRGLLSSFFAKDGGVKTDFVAPEFAMGGVMSGAGPLPLHRYAMGGVADSPQLAMFGEGRGPEAFVPLPDGRSIPVTMRGGGGGTTLVFNIDARGAETGVEAKIIAAIQAAAPSIIGAAKQAMASEVNRGGNLAATFGRRNK